MPGFTLGCYNWPRGCSYTQGFCYAWYHTCGLWVIQGPFIYTGFVLWLVSHLGVITDACLVSHLGVLLIHRAVHIHRASVMPGYTLGDYYWYMWPFINTKPGFTLRDYYWYMWPFINTKPGLHLGIITDTWGRSCTEGFSYAWCYTWGFLIHGAVHIHRVSVMPDFTLGVISVTWGHSYAQGFCYAWCHTWVYWYRGRSYT